MLRRSVISAIILFCSLPLFWGCPKKTEMETVPDAAQQQTSPAALASAPAASAQPSGASDPRERTAPASAKGLQTIYFDFDRSDVRDDARAIMKQNADWLRTNPSARLQIEGHCDERGTIEYNQALGQRRAANARKYLVGLGIAADRISLISYGKDKPVCTSASESCWQRNRRADFAVDRR